MDQAVIGKTTLKLALGDITQSKSAAIVNAANSRLAGGGGVDGAIHRFGGPAIMEECRRIGGCPTGQAVITDAGELMALKVIHTVGPIYRGLPADAELLASCYHSSLALARSKSLRTLSFPSISTGAYGYPIRQASRIAISSVINALRQDPDSFDRIEFVLFSKDDFAVYVGALKELTR